MNENKGNLFLKSDLVEMEAKGQKLPPYFENISKDITIHRKLKILIDKGSHFLTKIV